ncbi:MAG: heavy metal translocating P-type ATPase [Candidatus Dormibacteria bacterium]
MNLSSTRRPPGGLARTVPWARAAGPEVILVASVVGIAVGAGLWVAGRGLAADYAWGITTALALVPLTWTVLRDILRGNFGVDVIALIAMAGSLALGQDLAGAVVAAMLSGGDSLERFAAGRARRDLTLLVRRSPSVVHRYQEGMLVSPAIDEVRRGDRLLVKPGEVIPVDGVISSGSAVIDESALTGEALPVTRQSGDLVHSGTVNAGPPFDLHATETAESSRYASIVRLVMEAQNSKAPFVRMADRYAVWFLPLSLGCAGLAWMFSGSPIRALAVMVVATPCPLILAAPVAIIAGVSRAAARGVILKNGGTLEGLALARTVIFDKTGTLTAGTPKVLEVHAPDGMDGDDVIRLAASLDQVSPHVFAGAIVDAARERRLTLQFPIQVRETAGAGIEGLVGERLVRLGRASWLSGDRAFPEWLTLVQQETQVRGTTAVFVTVDGRFRGALEIEDPLRPDAADAVRALRRGDVHRVVVLTGDRKEVAAAIAGRIGADEVMWEQSPEDKVRVVRAESSMAPSVMIGDGINDAPALASAQVGVAMGARGATAASEAADAVIVVDNLGRLVDVMGIARHSMGIARQSVLAGMALSGGAMLAAAIGWLPPVQGALFQELIDVSVILNALRAMGTGPAVGRPSGAQRGERGDGPPVAGGAVHSQAALQRIVADAAVRGAQGKVQVHR